MLGTPPVQEAATFEAGVADAIGNLDRAHLLDLAHMLIT
jgi:hypothetical protein